MRLPIEMIPKSSWNQNLRSLLSKKEWDIIRKHSYERAGGRCDVCGIAEKLHCHEVWQFDDEQLIQYLVGLEAICNLCHMCHHIGFAITQSYKGLYNFEKVKKHSMYINGINEEQFNQYLLKETDVWVERSKKEWSIDIGYLQEYCHEHNIEL